MRQLQLIVDVNIILIEKAISKLLNKSNVNLVCEHLYVEYIYGNYSNSKIVL